MNEMVTLTASYMGAEFLITYSEVSVIRELLKEPKLMAEIGNMLDEKIRTMINESS